MVLFSFLVQSGTMDFLTIVLLCSEETSAIYCLCVVCAWAVYSCCMVSTFNLLFQHSCT